MQEQGINIKPDSGWKFTLFWCSQCSRRVVNSSLPYIYSFTGAAKRDNGYDMTILKSSSEIGNFNCIGITPHNILCYLTLYELSSILSTFYVLKAKKSKKSLCIFVVLDRRCLWDDTYIFTCYFNTSIQREYLRCKLSAHTWCETSLLIIDLN